MANQPFDKGISIGIDHEFNQLLQQKPRVEMGYTISSGTSRNRKWVEMKEDCEIAGILQHWKIELFGYKYVSSFKTRK